MCLSQFCNIYSPATAMMALLNHCWRILMAVTRVAVTRLYLTMP